MTRRVSNSGSSSFSKTNSKSPTLLVRNEHNRPLPKLVTTIGDSLCLIVLPDKAVEVYVGFLSHIVIFIADLYHDGAFGRVTGKVMSPDRNLVRSIWISRIAVAIDRRRVPTMVGQIG